MDGWLDGRGMFLSKLQRVGNHRAWRQEDGNNDSRWWGFRKMHSVSAAVYGSLIARKRGCVSSGGGFGNWNVGGKFCTISRRDEKQTMTPHCICCAHMWFFFQTSHLLRRSQTNKLRAIKFLHGTLMRQNFSSCMCECRTYTHSGRSHQRAGGGGRWKGMNLRWNNYTAAASQKNVIE